MVTDAVLNWLFDLIEAIIAGFPQIDMPTNILDLAFLSDMNYFIPVTEMFTLFMAFFLLGGPLAATSLIIWFFVGILRGGATKA